MALEPAFVTSFASRQMSQQLVAWASARQTRWDDQDLAQSLDRLIARQDRHRAPVKEWMPLRSWRNPTKPRRPLVPRPAAT